MLIPQVKCYYVLYKDVRCFQSILKTWIILMNKSRPTETGNPHLHQHNCDTIVHVLVVTKESFETFCVTWFEYNVHKSLCIFIAQLVSFVISNHFRIQIFLEFKFAYRYLNLYCTASVLVLVLVLCCTWSISAVSSLMPNTHRRRDATMELSRVGVGGVYWANGYMA